MLDDPRNKNVMMAIYDRLFAFTAQLPDIRDFRSKPMGARMLVHFTPSSAIVVGMLVVCLVMVLVFEATNGFHDTSNAVATVIYAQSLKPGQAVVWSAS
ncbi:hypothetical protein SBC1_72810 (plasmid) [Caballeronia sp. SBC1]|uniref:hypothetical protein n=1 Tax=unclassified Caballeronia TaxID=2646786 RepID=UPI0013E160D7|nr:MULTISPECIES: hypothetical protein [unclassified Caballeronia]QIE29332.1 hypothetical protein SBC2_74080 [Caballeronia sp. SBC2]QIN67234.1 hypothetical protein SBC1_72810 [Caballeronia sp. SBC1]